MSLKTDQSSCLTNKNVLLILMTIQIIMAILIPKHYLDIELKNHIWIWVLLTQSQIQ